MNLRIAKKILKEFDLAQVASRPARHNDFQVGVALARLEKTASCKKDRRYWDEVILPLYRPRDWKGK